MSRKIELNMKFVLKEYFNNKKSSIKIAEILNVSQDIVRARIKESGFNLRDSSQFNIGRTAWNKGKKMSNAHKKNMTTLWEKGHTPWNKGLSMNDTRVKNSINKMVKTRLKDGTYKCSEKRKKHMSIILSGRKKSPEHIEKVRLKSLGIKRSLETRKKLSKATLNYLQKHPERIDFLKKIRAKQIIPKKDTTIEVKIQKFLSLIHIEFFTHKYISGLTNSYQCDIFIPVQKGIPQKTIIEADGCYWHGCPICNHKPHKGLKERKIRDKIRTEELQENGFKVIRLWEHEIRPMTIKQFERKLVNGK